MTCERCGRESPDARFCTWCGARQTGAAAGAGGHRNDHYAAHPDEAVVQPSVFTTLFPHLGRNGVNEFRWAFVVGIAVLLVLYATGLVTAAIIVAAILVPLLYVMYLYEARVYRDAPIPVVGLTIGGGFILGIIVTLLTGALSRASDLTTVTPFGTTLDIAGLLLAAVLIPIVQEIVKPIPALILRRRPDFPETIDGLVFGVAAGLGFAAAVTIIQFSRVITSLPIQTDPGGWIYPLVTIAVLMPLMQGSASGVITGALWQYGRQPLTPFGIRGIAAAFIGHIAFVLGTLLLAAGGFDQFLSLAWQALVVGGLLIYVRLFLHDALLKESADLGLAGTTCGNCGSSVTAAGFCPVCGMALSASSRDARQPSPDLKPGPRVEGA
jgi:hypothetical protein